jgi:hypothetical protein
MTLRWNFSSEAEKTRIAIQGQRMVGGIVKSEAAPAGREAPRLSSRG